MTEPPFWRTFAQTLAKNPISTFAVLCVAGAAIFLGYMTLRIAGVLESPAWCGRAIQAERISPENFKGLEGCVELLKIQLQAMSIGFHISVGSFALTLVFLIVVVVAGARASAKVSATGMEFNVGKHDAETAANYVAEGAKEAADEVKEGTAPVPKPAAAAPAAPTEQLPDYAR